MPTILFIESLFKLFLAVILGGVLGYERERIGKAAGMRTYSLVAIGSTLFTILSLYGFGIGNAIDPSRVAANVVVGIGFIGAGLILHHGSQVQGLTTAAGLWSVAAIGMVIGVGWYGLAMVATIIIFLILFSSSKISVNPNKKYARKKEND